MSGNNTFTDATSAIASIFRTSRSPASTIRGAAASRHAIMPVPTTLPSNTTPATPITPIHSVNRWLHRSVIHQQNAGSITG